MSILVERTIALIKTETTYGTDPTPTSDSNFVAVYDVNVNPNINYIDPAAMDGSLSPREGRPGQRHVEVTFSHELQTNSSDPTTPPIDAALKACGFEASGGVYTPVSTGFASATIYVYWDGLLWKITGARGNPELVFAAGEPARINFTFTGLYNDPTDTSFPASWTDNGGAPLICQGGTLTWGGSTIPCVETLSINMNNDIQIRPCITGTYAVGGVEITNRNPEGSINPDMTTISEQDWVTLLNTPTLQAISFQVTNGSETVTVSIPKAQLMNIPPGTRNNYRTWEIPFKCVRNSGDDEISITFA